jgi:ABC-2 type transport system permease protein
MTALLKAELLKLRTTRGIYWYLGALVVLTGFAAAAQASDTTVFQREDPGFQRDLVSQSVTAPLLALLVGIVSATVEWRHGTITRTFLVTPRRWRVLAAKGMHASAVGVTLAAIGVGVALAVAIPILSNDDVSFTLDAALLERIAEIALASALWGALGVGLGALVQNQTGAVVGAVIFLTLVESLVAALLDWADLHWISDILPRHALDALAGHEAGLSPGAGGAVGLAYVVAFAAAAWLRIRRQDVT